METIRSFFREIYTVAAALILPMARSLRENTGLAVFSVVLAFGLWIFVTDSENPTRTRVLEDVDIPVEAVNIGPDVVVESDLDPQAVRVRVRAAEDEFEDLTAADFEAIVDLQGYPVGEIEVKVEVREVPDRRGVTIVEVIPDMVTVTIGNLASKDVPVTIDVQGEPASGFELGTPGTDASIARVLGPAGQVNQVARVVASIDVTGRTEPVDQAVRLEARNEQGTLVEKVEIEPRVVGIEIEIQQTTFSRPVAVIPQTNGAPARGYNVVAVTVSPQTVTVTGPQATIQHLVSLPTEAIDLNGRDADFSQEVSLDLPEGDALTLIGARTVEVGVDIEPARGTVRFLVPVSGSGVPAGLVIQGGLPAVEVSITGELPKLVALGPNDITVTADLSGRGAGTHTVPVSVRPPSGLSSDAIEVSPAEIQVTLAPG